MTKRSYHLEHVYTGEEEPTPLALDTVSIFVAGKRKKTRVVTQPFSVPRTDLNADHSPPPGPPPDPTTPPDVPPAAAKDSASDIGGDLDTSDNCDAVEGEGESQKTFRQSAYSKIEAFLPHLDELQQSFMLLEIEDNIGGACGSCKALNSAIYRCCECFNRPALCAKCIVKDHRLQPLHQIEVWAETHFDACTLRDLGLVIHLGHDGKQCPASCNSQEIVIVHTNGIHRCLIRYCDCNDLIPNFQQLMLGRYFPTTLKFPATAFTFALLKMFHQLTLSSKITPYDYFDSLKKLTNTAFPQDVDDRYRELMSVMRIWRHLAERRRSGQEHGIDTEVPYRRSNSLAIRCPACPEIHFNVDADKLKFAPETDMHIYTLFLSFDGNYRLSQLAKSSDPRDTPLNQGNAYFVNEVKFNDFLKHHEDSSTPDSTCSKLKAVRQQQLTKFSNTTFSGVMAGQCARHGFYLPQGIVNLVKGETYVRTDFALGSALGTEALLQRWIMISYDIWCQYSIHLKARLQRRFPHLAALFEKIRGAVPSMHVHGHGEKCQLFCSFAYMKYSGMTCGEGIEGAWAEQNHAAGSTKEQSSGHRQDTLDDFNAYWNWTKLHRLSKYLLSQFERCQDEFVQISADFLKLSSRFSPETIQQWKEMETRPFIGRDGKPRSLFQVDSAQVPSQHTQSERLTGMNTRTADNLADADESIALIEEAIEIELLQLSVRQLAATKDTCQDTLNDSRQDLRKAVDQWRIRYHELFPLAFPHGPASNPENEILELPSSYTLDLRQQYGLSGLASFEYEIRLGHAYDSIDDVRTAIHVYNASSHRKRTEVFGQKPATRAWGIIINLKNDIRECSKRYAISYTALLSLGLPPNFELKPIKDDELWGKDMTSVRKQGSSKHKEPWFWVIGKPKGLSNDAWELELDRVRWFRTQAAHDRCLEEIEILNEEFSRTFCSFTKMSTIWKKIGDKQFELKNSTPRLARGYCAFACRQAAMYTKLAMDTVDHWEKARSPRTAVPTQT